MSRRSNQVFLSFRGVDTRKTFTDHLYTALLQAGIRTYIDNEINRGARIESELHTAIEQSAMSIIVFSKRYASSKWCLDELVKIMQQKRDCGHIVIPVFYDVDPSEVRHHKGNYTLEFVHKEWIDKVEGWRAALTEVAGLDGMVLQNEANGHESKFIQKIVEEVGRKLNRTVLNVSPYLLGLESRIKPINSWLQDECSVIKTAVIYGMGGIGKSTIARTVFNQNLDQFEAGSFLANVRATCTQPNGIVRLQKQLLSDILRGKKEKVYSPEEGAKKIYEATSRKKVLLVLDDADTKEQHKILGYSQLFQGSRVIITTRLVLKEHVGYRMFKVRKLDDWESLQLLSWHAFGQKYPIETYLQQSKSIVHLCDGLPLALGVLGSSLSGETVATWTSALEKMQEIPDSEIQKVLQISYDSLLDDHDKNLFLDIACFFVGKDRDYTTKILDNCGFYTTIGIQNLVNRCLITISNNNRLMMHQLLRDMGREIVRQESPEEPGKRSRLWRHEDSLNVLKDESGTESIKGIVLNLPIPHKNEAIPCTNDSDDTDDDDFPGLALSRDNYESIRNFPEDSWRHLNRLSRENYESIRYFPKDSGSHLNRSIPGFKAVQNEVALRSDAIARMHRLRFLQLNYVQLTGKYKEFPRTLRLLCWHGFPYKTVPDAFHLDNLVVIDMRHSSLKQFCKGTRFLRSLKILDLSYSHRLAKTPDFSETSKLEILMLKDCISLIEVDKSIASLERLALLNLKGCNNLRSLPLLGLKKSLQKLILSGCSKLEELPMEMLEMGSLAVLKADGLALNQARLKGEFKYWRSPKKIPESINLVLASLPCSLVSLSLANCHLIDGTIPNDLSMLTSLHSLNLSGNNIFRLPQSIKYLTQLELLQLDSCRRLESLPELPPSLKNLHARDCVSLERTENLPNLLNSLHLEMFGCESLVEIKGLFKLEPISGISKETINDMELLKVVSIGNTGKVNIANSMTQTEKKIPLQGLYECGVFSVFLQGNQVPNWFCGRTIKSDRFSFHMPQHTMHKIRGLNVCIVYSFSYRYSYTCGDVHYTKITNKSKGHRWTYSPTFYGIPDEADGTMLWLSYWKFDEDQLEGGDEVTLSVIMSNSFEVKECGFHVVYDDDEKVEEQSQLNGVGNLLRNHTLFQDEIIEKSMLNSQTTVGTGPLCHHRFLSHQQYPKIKYVDVDHCFHGCSNAMRLHYYSRPWQHGVRLHSKDGPWTLMVSEE